MGRVRRLIPIPPKTNWNIRLSGGKGNTFLRGTKGGLREFNMGNASFSFFRELRRALGGGSLEGVNRSRRKLLGNR